MLVSFSNCEQDIEFVKVFVPFNFNCTVITSGVGIFQLLDIIFANFMEFFRISSFVFTLKFYFVEQYGVTSLNNAKDDFGNFLWCVL